MTDVGIEKTKACTVRAAEALRTMTLNKEGDGSYKGSTRNFLNYLFIYF